MTSRMIEPWEWDMVFGGDAPDELVARARADSTHEAQRRRWEEEQRQEARWRYHLYRFDCPKPLTLAEYRGGHLDQNESDRVAGHTALCLHCQSELEALGRFTALPIREPAAAPQEALVRRIVLKLFSASGSHGAPALALRGDSQSVRYASGDYMLSLTRRSDTEGSQLIGSLLGEGGSGTVALRREQEIVRLTALSEAATFTLDSVPEGDYELVIALPQVELVVPSLLIDR